MISMKSLEHVGKTYVGPNNWGIINVTESFLEDIFNNQVSNVFYSDAFGISARGLNEVLRGRSLFGHKTTRDSAKVRLAKCILKKRKKLRLTPWERVTVWGEFPLSCSNSEFEPFGFGHHVDRASINSLERRTTWGLSDCDRPHLSFGFWSTPHWQRLMYTFFSPKNDSPRSRLL